MKAIRKRRVFIGLGTTLLLFLLLTENILQQNARRSFLNAPVLAVAWVAEAPSEEEPQSVAPDEPEGEPQSVAPDEPEGEPQSVASDEPEGEPQGAALDETQAGTQGDSDGRALRGGTGIRVGIVAAGMIILIIGIGMFSKRKDESN